MRYLVSYDSLKAEPERGERLRIALVDLCASPYHRWSWTIETRLTARELVRRLRPLLDDGDRFLVVDITGREVVAEQVTSATRALHEERQCG